MVFRLPGRFTAYLKYGLYFFTTFHHNSDQYLNSRNHIKFSYTIGWSSKTCLGSPCLPACDFWQRTQRLYAFSQTTDLGLLWLKSLPPQALPRISKGPYRHHTPTGGWVRPKSGQVYEVLPRLSSRLVTEETA